MNYRILAGLFTSSNISKVANGDFTTIYRAMFEFPTLQDMLSLEEVYDEAYKILCKYYPNEYVFKNTIANNILLGTHSMKTASMLSELRIGTNKADCVIINGISTCYEIKSQYDSLKRLEDQLATYTYAFDKTYVVIHEIHLKSVLSMYLKSPNFGIIVSNNGKCLSKRVDAPRVNSYDANSMFHTLRKHEYIDIFIDIKGEIPKYSDALMSKECKKVFCELEIEEANEQFKRVLKKYRRNDEEFINELPKSMKNLGISFKIKKADKLRLTSLILKNMQFFKDKDNVFSVYERQTV